MPLLALSRHSTPRPRRPLSGAKGTRVGQFRMSACDRKRTPELVLTSPVSFAIMVELERRGVIQMRRRDALGIAGAVAAWPLFARANDSVRIPKIGVLWHAANPAEEAPYFTSLVEGFRSLGYGDGRI